MSRIRLSFLLFLALVVPPGSGLAGPGLLKGKRTDAARVPALIETLKGDTDEKKRKAFDLRSLGTQRDIVVGAFTQHDRTHVQSGTRREAHFCHLRVVLQRIARSIGGRLEQHEQSI